MSVSVIEERSPRSPPHGIPLLIKDNIDTRDRMATTAGSLALIGSQPPEDAVVVQQLRAALIAPTAGPAWRTDLVPGDHSLGGGTAPAAAAGTPSITMPSGQVQGFPVGLNCGISGLIPRGYPRPPDSRHGSFTAQAYLPHRAPHPVPAYPDTSPSALSGDSDARFLRP